MRIYNKLLTDTCKFSKQGVANEFGRFFYSCSKLRDLTGMVKECNNLLETFLLIKKNFAPMDEDQAHYAIAFNFPGILVSCTGKHWSKMSPVYMELSKSLFINVRRTLACSITEIIRVLKKDALKV